MNCVNTTTAAATFRDAQSGAFVVAYLRGAHRSSVVGTSGYATVGVDRCDGATARVVTVRPIKGRGTTTSASMIVTAHVHKGRSN
jgi:hypothetical protein